jgi:hypothetical protein
MTPSPGRQYGQVVQDCPLKKKPEKTWIAIELVGEDDKPVPGVPYRIILVDGTIAEGTLDGKGAARIDGIDPGTCVVTFPDFDQDAWTGI